MSNFDVNGYNSHECDIHNHGYYLGAQSQQAKIDELHARINEALFKIKRSHGRVMGAYLEDILKGESE